MYFKTRYSPLETVKPEKCPAVESSGYIHETKTKQTLKQQQCRLQNIPSPQSYVSLSFSLWIPWEKLFNELIFEEARKKSRESKTSK